MVVIVLVFKLHMYYEFMYQFYLSAQSSTLPHPCLLEYRYYDNGPSVFLHDTHCIVIVQLYSCLARASFREGAGEGTCPP